MRWSRVTFVGGRPKQEPPKEAHSLLFFLEPNQARHRYAGEIAQGSRGRNFIAPFLQNTHDLVPIIGFMRRPAIFFDCAEVRGG